MRLPLLTQLAIDVLDALPSLTSPRSLARIRKDLPIYVFSGERDPVGANIQGLIDALKGAGFTRLTTRIYPGARHETLNETNREEVTRDLIDWLDAVVGKRPYCTRPGCSTGVARLSRDSLNDQRIDSSLPVQGSHGCVDCAVEGVGISEGLMGQMACLEIVPDNLDVVEFGCVFWQPLDGEPVFARLDGFKSELADMDRPVVLDQYDRFYCPSWLRTEQMVELLEVSDEVAAALGLARMHNQLARDMIE